MDTTPEARAVQLAAQRSMGPAGRVALAVEMSEELRLVTLGGLRERHPEATDVQLMGLLIELWHGPDLAEKVSRMTDGS